jgi:hypothetical protein
MADVRAALAACGAKRVCGTINHRTADRISKTRHIVHIKRYLLDFDSFLLN